MTPETLVALNQTTGPKVEFYVPTAAASTTTTEKKLWVKFPTAADCRAWCNDMNLSIFPKQVGVVLFLRMGAQAQELGPVLRLPMEFDHLVRYILEGTVFYDGQGDPKWKFRDQKPIGHWEVGYGREPFQTWIDRQFERLVRGAFLLSVE